MKEAKIKHVFGNVLRIAIPLTLRTVELVDVDVDGEIEQQAQVTDTDFIPSSDYPVNVVFSKGAVKVSLKAEMRDGNIAYVEDIGKISVGTYDITVTCNDNDGNPYRFKQNTILQVVDATADAGIETPIEYEVTTWYLDAAIYLVMKGEDGVGIEDIITESSGEIGGVNTVTFVLTNGETRSFTILNGSGSVDSDFDENSLHPLSNSVITNKFKSIDANIAGLFGDVDYDSSSKILRFWDITKSTILATIDARPFVKDGMVNRVYIQNRTLVITFNTDSGHDTIAISLDSVFNPNNYYTRSQIDNRIANEISSATSGLMAKSVFVYEGTNNIKHSVTPEIVLSYIEGVSMFQEDYAHLFGTSNGHIKGYTGPILSDLVDYGLAPTGLVFLDNTSGLFYRWDYTTWQQVGNSSGGYEPPVGGIPKTDLASDVQTSLGKADTALQSSDLTGYATTNFVETAVSGLVDSAPEALNTLNELAAALGDDENFATTMTTALGNKVDKVNGKGLSTNDYTDADKTKLAGLSNYDDTTLAGRVTTLENAGYITTETDPTVPSWAKASSKPSYTASEVGAVPTTRKVNNKALSEDITLSASDVGAVSSTGYVATDNNFTSTLKDKLDGIEAGAEVNVQADWGQTTTTADDYIKNKPTIPTKVSDLNNDSGFLNKVFYKGSCSTSASAMPKVCTVETFPTTTEEVDNETITHAKDYTIIAVTFSVSDTNTTAAPSLNVNSIGAKAISYSNAIVTSEAKNTTVAGTKNNTHYYYYDSSLDSGNGAWVFIVKAPDLNTTYSAMTQAEVDAGSSTTGRIISPKMLRDNFYTEGEVDTALSAKANTADLATVATSGTYSDLSGTPTIPTKVSDLTNDSGFTSNAGTITGITMNNVSKGTSGVVDLGTVITAHQDISGKANTSDLADVATSGSYNDLTNKPTIPDVSGFATTAAMNTALAGKQDTLTFDTTPTANSTKPVTSGGIKNALDAKADAADVPTNQDMADAIDDALAEAQVTVVPAGSVGVISSLGSDSDSNALSASMGKKLKVAVITILNSLGNYAFPEGKPVIDWGDDTPVTYTVQKTIGTGLSATGGDADVDLGDSLEVTIAITDNLYIIDDDSVVVTMGGAPVVGAWNASTMKVTIAAVTGNVVINVPSITYVPSGLVFQLDCKNRGEQVGHWVDLIGGIDFTLGSGVTESDNGVEFDGTQNAYGTASGSLNQLASAGATIEVVATVNRLPAPLLINPVSAGISARIYSDGNNSYFLFMMGTSGTATTGSFNYSGSDADVSVNKERVLIRGSVYGGTISNTTTGNSTNHQFAVGARLRTNGGTNEYLLGKIMAIRVYSSSLSESNQKRNYAIDKKRFNLS